MDPFPAVSDRWAWSLVRKVRALVSMDDDSVVGSGGADLEGLGALSVSVGTAREDDSCWREVIFAASLYRDSRVGLVKRRKRRFREGMAATVGISDAAGCEDDSGWSLSSAEEDDCAGKINELRDS